MIENPNHFIFKELRAAWREYREEQKKPAKILTDAEKELKGKMLSTAAIFSNNAPTPEKKTPSIFWSIQSNIIQTAASEHGNCEFAVILASMRLK